MRSFWFAALCLCLSACASDGGRQAVNEKVATPIQWQPWSADVFTQAKAQHKLVLLDLGAVWCHWCHVMDEKTYHNPQVMGLINDGFIAVRVDQDARPDLSMRYEDYGWPATIIFNADQTALVKRQGYIPPQQMAMLLKAVKADPTPQKQTDSSDKIDTKVSSDAATQLPIDSRRTLIKRLTNAYDHKQGGWGSSQKFLVWDNVEYCLRQAADGALKNMAKETLDAQLNLLDPVWGGVYQYSTRGDWQHPHYEKIMQFQAQNLKVYARASHRLDEPRYLKAALAIRQYLKDFLTAPDGSFYTSQDADLVPGQHAVDYFNLNDAQRRKLGVPRVDKHQYARENGWAIEALCALAADEPAAVQEAIVAAKWVIKNRSRDDGGFSHDADDPAGPYLGDTLAMGQAFLALYQVTADDDWLERSVKAADFIAKHFELPAGIASTATEISTGLSPEPHKNHNIEVARFANLLFHHTGEASHRKLADHAMRYVVSPQVAIGRSFAVGGLLVADEEFGKDPMHVAIVGPFGDAATKALWRESLSWFDWYKRIDVVDAASGHRPRHMEVAYPQLDKPAAFFCQGSWCSSPVSDPVGLHDLMLERSMK